MKKFISLFVVFCLASFLLCQGSWVKEGFYSISKAVEKLNSLSERDSLSAKFMTPTEYGSDNCYLFYQDKGKGLERSGLIWTYKEFSWPNLVREFLDDLPRERAREAKLIRPNMGRNDYFVVYRFKK